MRENMRETRGKSVGKTAGKLREQNPWLAGNCAGKLREHCGKNPQLAEKLRERKSRAKYRKKCSETRWYTTCFAFFTLSEKGKQNVKNTYF